MYWKRMSFYTTACIFSWKNACLSFYGYGTTCIFSWECMSFYTMICIFNWVCMSFYRATCIINWFRVSFFLQNTRIFHWKCMSFYRTTCGIVGWWHAFAVETANGNGFSVGSVLQNQPNKSQLKMHVVRYWICRHTRRSIERHAFSAERHAYTSFYRATCIWFSWL